jgi:hypothetical protein
LVSAGGADSARIGRSTRWGPKTDTGQDQVMVQIRAATNSAEANLAID